MPTQKESQAAGLSPMINLGLSAEDAPNNRIMQNEPNLILPAAPIMRNEPNLNKPTNRKDVKFL